MSASRRRYPDDARVRALIRLAREEGLDPGGVEVSPDGTVRVLPKPAAPRDAAKAWLDSM